MEIPVIKEVTTVPLSAGDKRLAEIFDITVANAGTIRREMKWFPAFRGGIQNSGLNVDIETFKRYFTYRGSFEWKKEFSKIKKGKSNAKQNI